ncbi:MAG TPA: helix-turn-helix transcriptional regulator [Gemmatimonadaceae bacterium]|jgi:transcriptional regulator with XRE-family HTH domain|nr:helix-turn-helix transcriptional regulator [Gemmatimonadaceae bacterium]
MRRNNTRKSIEHQGSLLVRARTMAGLSQRELATRAATAQSVVARIEGGQTTPGVETLDRLLAAAGFELRRTLELKPVVNSHMLEDSARILRLSPIERLREVANVSRFVTGARRV